MIIPPDVPPGLISYDIKGIISESPICEVSKYEIVSLTEPTTPGLVQSVQLDNSCTQVAVQNTAHACASVSIVDAAYNPYPNLNDLSTGISPFRSDTNKNDCATKFVTPSCNQV